MSFAQVMKLVKNMQFDCIVFDTAPTGHTLRFLQFPSLLDKGLGKLMSIKNKFSSLFSQVSSMFSIGATPEQMQDKMEQTRKIIEEVHNQFRNPNLTQFVCVCIPEFLSLYETERMVQELNKFSIDVNNIIINQVLYPSKDSTCELCTARSKMQRKYVDQIQDLYEEFHVIKLPLQKSEIRGAGPLENFSKNMLEPYDEKYQGLSKQ
eukprot:TRINITY_DN2421_c0_g1_i2.p1 TRINITY_DN2421_c0_g1~~TRINITY_DN2421_c0_g1_i2.p1  ORF type:complete len:207 (-),score=35.81 TRINITY_DN2421_c0_g1_i2:88-708(-)